MNNRNVRFSRPSSKPPRLPKSVVFAACLSAAAACGCAPGLGRTVSVSRIPQVVGVNVSESYSMPPKARIDRFDDLRPYPGIVEIDGRMLPPSEDVATEVKHAMERDMQDAGVQLAISRSALIRGGVREWKAKVEPGFPSSKVSARASIRLEVVDEQDNVVYAASYSGKAAQEHPILDEGKIENTLGGAMANAIRQALQDERLIQTLVR